MRGIADDVCHKCAVVGAFVLQFRTVFESAVGVDVVYFVVESRGSKMDPLEVGDIHGQEWIVVFVELQVEVASDDELILSPLMSEVWERAD